MWTRKELKEKAYPAFKANYWMSVLSAIVISIFAAASGNASRRATNSDGDSSGISGIIAMVALLTIMTIILIVALFKIIVGNSLIVGAQKNFINNEIDPENVNVHTLVFIFSNGYWKNVALTMFLKDLFTALWTLLLIVPGIIKGYEYRMIPYLLAENPEMDHKEAFARSKEMMTGQKWDAFVLDLSFIGWFLLNALTLGILGIFYVHPYYYQTAAELYLALKKNA